VLVWEYEDNLISDDSSNLKINQAATGSNKGDRQKVVDALVQAAQARFAVLDDQGRPSRLRICVGQYLIVN
jgi:hypothetical protein